MNKMFQVESTLTDRYQTTIPEAVREFLHLSKRDKIHYVIEANGKVLLSRAQEDDPEISAFLSFLASHIKNNPEAIHAISPILLQRAENLVSGVTVNLNTPLNDQDE